MNSFFDDIADIYDETRGFPKETMNEVIEIMAKELEDSKKVLEIGVGTGRLAEPLKKNGIEIVGVDISKKMLNIALSKDLDSLVLGDATSLPFKDSSFDSVISVHVLHLISDWEKAVIEVKRTVTGKLISILYKRSGFQGIEEYKEALNSCNYPLRTPGIKERALKDLISPVTIIPIKPFKDILTIRERLRYLKERKHSYTPKTPTEIHELAIKYLENKHARNLNSFATIELEVVIWDIADLSRSIIVVVE
jgi:SAM-dependent methyltransferase